MVFPNKTKVGPLPAPIPIETGELENMEAEPTQDNLKPNTEELSATNVELTSAVINLTAMVEELNQEIFKLKHFLRLDF